MPPKAARKAKESDVAATKDQLQGKIPLFQVKGFQIMAGSITTQEPPSSPARPAIRPRAKAAPKNIAKKRPETGRKINFKSNKNSDSDLEDVGPLIQDVDGKSESGDDDEAPTTPTKAKLPVQNYEESARKRVERVEEVRRNGPAGNKNRKAAKDVWFFMEAESHPENKGRRKCILCREKNANKDFGPTTATSTIRKHLRESHGKVWVDRCKAQGIIVADENDIFGVFHAEALDNRPKFSHALFVDYLAEFIVADDQSLNVVESPYLRSIFLLLRSQLQDSDIPKRTTMRKRIMEMYDEHIVLRIEHFKRIPGRISFTTDMWTDPSGSPFMAVTGHWMELEDVPFPQGSSVKAKVCVELLGFQRVPGKHSGQHLAHAFLHIISRFELENKIGWITADNASNNDTFMACLEHLLVKKGVSFDKDANRIRCFPHVVNLAVKAMLKAITDMSLAEIGSDFALGESHRDAVALIRALIKKIRASPVHKQALELEAQKQGINLQLLIDVATRWGSTRIMLERVLCLRQPLERLLEQKAHKDLKLFSLYPDEWDMLNELQRILEIPGSYQQILSFSATPTLCDAIPAYESMQAELAELKHGFPKLSHIIDDGLNVLERYQTRTEVVPAYTLALALDTVSKNDILTDGDQFRPLRLLLLQHLRPYYKSPKTPTPRTQTPETSQAPKSDREKAMANLRIQRRLPVARTAFGDLEAEVDAYLSDGSSEETVLAYWEKNKNLYPTLFSLAMDILPIPGSAVPCERVFSSAKETTTDRRNRISGDLMQALQVLKFSLQQRGGEQISFTSGTSWESLVEIMEKGAEDLTSYSTEETYYQTALLQSS